MTESSYKYLYRIDSPADLRKLSQQELVGYCDELRRFIIEQLALNPGHLGSSLGVVELTAALHYVFDTPYDKLIWDVGHQAYAHKIITGRRDSFRMNRKLNGLSGFPKMEESAYDAFGGGHASTSISAALGIATAAALRGERRHAVAVIGDGALTGGLAFEGLNNAGAANTDLLVILNDNRMAIDPNVGALKEYLLSISTSKRYNAVKNRAWAHMERTPRLRRLIQKVGNALKQGFLQQSNLFESLRFRYFGPVDGHNVEQLTRVLKDLKEIPGRGISAVVEGRQVCAGNRMMMEELGFSPEEVQAGGTVVYAAVDGSYAGCILLEDTVKPGAREALAELRALGVRETVMLTGDREHAAASVAQRLGLTRWFAGLLPQDKVEKVRELQESKDTLIFVGDGVNDAPVLAMAGVGVAMGGIGSDAAVEAADLVLLKDDLRSLPKAIRISRKTMAVARQNIIFALAVKFAVLLLSILGMASMWLAVFADVGVAVLAILNATRAGR